MDWRVRLLRRHAFNEPGHAHELTFSCHRRFQFLIAERTCQWLANAIDQARTQLDFALWAYVFMPEHVHLIVHPRGADYDIPTILKKIKEPTGRMAITYLRRYAVEWLPRIAMNHGERVEHRFWAAGGGYDRNITEAKTLMLMVDYIHQNPVRRGLAAHAREWKWSSAGWFGEVQPNTLAPDKIPVEWSLG